MSERFYINWPLQVGPALLEGSEAHHLATVCRLRPGDAVCLFNGDGHEYPARVVAAGRRRVELEILAKESPPREAALRLEVAAPVPKGDRAQFLVEKLTELGVAVFTPLQTARSVVHPREAKLEKLQRHVIEASKQCGRNVLMEVRSLSDWSAYCRRDDLPAVRWLAHPGASQRITGNLPGDALWAVGPEGGWTDSEVADAVAAGWQAFHLGPRILRIETAALLLPMLLQQFA